MGEIASSGNTALVTAMVVERRLHETRRNRPSCELQSGTRGPVHAVLLHFIISRDMLKK